ncbi:hypothetical protein LTR01_009046 [Friedmanniomyces endolithicus]|nr:hypothetical protein LTR01_009046 [Friedmanniomyces endolithicus]KAK0822884.1 hypothetical protein LTR73_008951 [Friedmanniomyces endolithicus]
MAHMLREQLVKDVEHFCEPFESCGAYGAPSKLRWDSYGYTFNAKGTALRLWSTVSREAQLYQVFHTVQGYTVQGYTVQGYTVQGSTVQGCTVQGSAVPIFHGSFDTMQTYFLHGAGEIQHMLPVA